MTRAQKLTAGACDAGRLAGRGEATAFPCGVALRISRPSRHVDLPTGEREVSVSFATVFSP
jgi:hypothetical protein